MPAYNHLSQINMIKFREIAEPLFVANGFLHLRRNGTEYKMPMDFIAVYVPTNKFFIQMDKVNKFLEKVDG